MSGRRDSPPGRWPCTTPRESSMSDIENPSVPPAAPPPVAPAYSAEERQWATFTHLSALSGIVTGGLGSVVGPLVMWLVKKDTMPFVDDQGKEALNFNITLWIVGLALT